MSSLSASISSFPSCSGPIRSVSSQWDTKAERFKTLAVPPAAALTGCSVHSLVFPTEHVNSLTAEFLSQASGFPSVLLSLQKQSERFSETTDVSHTVCVTDVAVYHTGKL